MQREPPNMLLLFDTETTGISRIKDRAVQLAWTMADQHGQVQSRNSYIIKPAGFSIPEAVVRVHGISTSRALRDGHDLATVLTEFSTDVKRSRVVIGHNIAFDLGIIANDFAAAKTPKNHGQPAPYCSLEY